MSNKKIDDIILDLDQNQIDSLYNKLLIIRGRKKKRQRLTKELVNPYIDELVDMFSKSQPIYSKKTFQVKFDICIDHVYIYETLLKEELEKESAKQIAELKVNYDNYIKFSDKIADKINVKTSDLRYFVKARWFEINKTHSIIENSGDNL